MGRIGIRPGLSLCLQQLGLRSASAPEITRSPVVISPKRELHALTGLRFFAAFSVVIYHFAQPLFAGAAAPIRSLAGTGYIAVSLFFLLSGFVLSYSYLNRQGDMRGSRRGFWAARFARIYPGRICWPSCGRSHQSAVDPARKSRRRWRTETSDRRVSGTWPGAGLDAVDSLVLELSGVVGLGRGILLSVVPVSRASGWPSAKEIDVCAGDVRLMDNRARRSSSTVPGQAYYHGAGAERPSANGG